MSEVILKCQDVYKKIGKKYILKKISFEVKKGEITRVAFTNEQLHKYFPNSYTPAMMKREILALLKLWKKESWES